MKSSPLVVVDRTLLWALSIWYTIFAVWGIVAFIFGIATVQLTTGNLFGNFYSLAIVAVSLSLLGLPLRETHRAEIVEKYLTPIWVAFVSIYPVTLLIQILTQPDQVARVHVFVLVLALMVFPVWRFLFLIRKHRPDAD